MSASVLDAMPEAEARRALTRCCGASRWVTAMLGRRPFGDDAALLAAADALWDQMDEPDVLEAFTHHPEIGSNLDALRDKFGSTAAWSSSEQGAVASATEEVLVALRDDNVVYRERFGFIFIVCATGKTAAEMLDLLRGRLDNPRDVELSIAAAEQGKITKIRLAKLADG